MNTVLVVTIKTDDGVTVHVRLNTACERDVLFGIMAERFGPEILEDVEVTEQPSTWECDGRDGCRVVA
jgi:hypothetical protein